MVKFKFTLTNILFWVGVLSSILLFENLDFFSKSHGKYGQLPMDAFIILFSLAAISYLAMFILDFVYNKSRFSYFGFIIFGALMAAMVISIYKFNGMSFGGYAPDYFLDDTDRIRQTLTTLCFILTLYAIFTVFINNHPSIKRLMYVFIIVLIVCYVLIAFTFVLEADAYKAINSGTPGNASIKSLFYNQNMFAALLVLGSVSAIGLNYFKKNVISYISVLFFLVIQVYVRSLTAILISLVLVLAFYLIEILFNFKKKPKLAMAEMSIFVTLVVGLTITAIACNVTYVGGLSDFCHYLFNELFSTDYENLSNRVYLWQLVIELVTMGRTVFMFGYGPLNGDWVLGGYRLSHGGAPNESYRISAHSAYFQILLNYGVVGAALFVLFLVLYIYCLICLFKKNKRFCFLFFLMALAYLALGVTESLIPFGMNAQGLIIGAFVFLPVITKYRHYKRKSIGEDVIKSSVPTLLDPALMVRKTARFILSFILAISVLLVFPQNSTPGNNFNLIVNVLVMLIFALLTVPYLTGLWAKNTSVNRYLVKVLLNSLLLVVVTAGITLLFLPLRIELGDTIAWIIPGTIGFVILMMVLISSIRNRGTIGLLYFNTFIAFKTCLSSLIVSIGFIIAAYFLNGVIFSFTSMYSIIGLPILTLLLFYVSSFIIPFKDTRSIIRYENSYDFNLLKREVVRERLKDGI